MYLADASQKLFEWFLKNSNINLKTDLKKLIPLSEDYLGDEASVSIVLEDMVEDGTLRTHTCANGDTIWVLPSSFEERYQSIEINNSIASDISTIINNFAALSGDKDINCDPNNIHGGDILNLLQITSMMANRIKEMEDSKESDE